MKRRTKRNIIILMSLLVISAVSIYKAVGYKHSCDLWLKDKAKEKPWQLGDNIIKEIQRQGGRTVRINYVDTTEIIVEKFKDTYPNGHIPNTFKGVDRRMAARIGEAVWFTEVGKKEVFAGRPIYVGARKKSWRVHSGNWIGPGMPIMEISKSDGRIIVYYWEKCHQDFFLY